MHASELLASLQHRMGQSKSGRVSIDSAEIAHWPIGLFDTLQSAKLVQRDQPATLIECDGCEESCMMEVNVIAPSEARVGRAFIVCDKRNDVGRVPVAFARLQRWFVTEAAIQKLSSQYVVAEGASLKRSKSTLAFRAELDKLLTEIETRAKEDKLPFDRQAMPGRKIDLQALANAYSAELKFKQSTFDDYLKGLCAFKRGARETNFYRQLFPECFK